MMRVIATLAALLTALCFATGALAHAALVSAEPAEAFAAAEDAYVPRARHTGRVSLIDAVGKTRTSPRRGPPH